MSGENYRWGPEVVSEHVVRVRGKRRRRKVKDTGGCGSSQATRRLSPLLKRPVWNHGAYPCLTAPHAISRRARWPCWPATTQLEQNESRVGFGVSSEEGRWDSLCFSQSRTRGTRKPGPWGCCQKAHSLTFCGGSTEWNQVFFQPMPECIGCPTGHLPPPHRQGFWLALYQTAVLGATGGRPRLCPGQQLHCLTQPGKMDLMRLCPPPQLLPKPGHSTGCREGKPRCTCTKELLLCSKGKQKACCSLPLLSVSSTLVFYF